MTDGVRDSTRPHKPKSMPYSWEQGTLLPRLNESRHLVSILRCHFYVKSVHCLSNV